MRRDYMNKSNKEIFTDIYSRKIWGDGIKTPLSGSGSDPDSNLNYVQFVKKL